MIDFALTEEQEGLRKMVHGLSENLFRSLARHYDEYEHEHDEVTELEQVASLFNMQNAASRSRSSEKSEDGDSGGRPRGGGGGVTTVVAVEEIAWGDVGLMLAIPGSGLGNAAINAVGTPEQKEKHGKSYAAMAITEPGCGSDTASITTSAELDETTKEWILNGEKIFVTGGQIAKSVVVWATLDKSQGRPAIKSFLVEKGTPGCTVSKLEDKLGIRASDTASISLQDCRVPYENLLGSPEISSEKGFTGVMKTFDNTRPIVAAQALGVARAALEFTKAKLEEEGFTFPYDRGKHELSVVQEAILDMEANLEVARLLTWRAASMGDTGERNSLEASMGKAKAGRAATLVTQRCVEILGPLGYSCEWLAEKWMRDSKITDLFEGTGQIQMLIIAREILDYSRDQLK